MRLLLSLAVLTLSLASVRADTPEEVFSKRIVPIFKSPNPSSCTQCHLSGVDLKDYIRPSHRETFLSLRDQGLVDLDHPEKSKILHLIDMGKDAKKATDIQQKNRTAEYEAFAAWVKASCADATLRTAPKLAATNLAKPAKPNEVIRHARTDRVMESFENTVWALRFRCASCHTTEAVEKRAKEKPLESLGANMAWIRPTAEETLAYLTKSRLVDAKNPERSLLLLKPLNDEIKHGGGVKFVVGDQGYKAYRSFVDDYAAVVNGMYAKSDELPKKLNVVQFGTQSWLKIQNTPPAWADKYMAVKLYAWDTTTKKWQANPVATTDRKVWGGGKLWQHNLTLLTTPDSADAKKWKTATPTLPGGKYLVKVYLDATDRLAKDWKAELSDDDFVGEAVVESQWPTGYGKMTVLDATAVKK
ncbi:hypothetical protein [Limnoglobus roseus]|uniref:Cytochrome c domain-containing protein n=1 Tax=Limnoglobus roseus TaxID=2598579 RepID=A0A5C1A5Q1_9BACT|nr:hypothetical protein [Limnoglobus roseus]QEL14489.1 hypothetical protein PX52LOC_01378 [Limnoglobus roseus]